MDCPKKKKSVGLNLCIYDITFTSQEFLVLFAPPPITYYGSQRSGLKPFASEVVKMNEFFIIFGKSIICIN